MTSDDYVKQSLFKPWACILFSVLCFITALFMSGNKELLYDEKITANGPEIVPIDIAEDDTVIQFELFQKLNEKEWNFVTSRVLDKDKSELYRFERELWAERSSDGFESVNSISTKLTMPKSGKYFIEVATDRSKSATSDIHITIREKTGSCLPHLIAGLFSLFIAIILFHTNSDPKSVKAFYKGLNDND